MNNFVFSQDPLLYNSATPVHMSSDTDIKRQLDMVMAQYQSLQQKPPQEPKKIEDVIGSLDDLVKTLDDTIIESLNNDTEFVQINDFIQQSIQKEIINLVKHNLNTNQEIINKVNRARDIIQNIKTLQDQENRRSMNELNEYITHYSDMTFNEYKQLKSVKK